MTNLKASITSVKLRCIETFEVKLEIHKEDLGDFIEFLRYFKVVKNTKIEEKESG